MILYKLTDSEQMNIDVNAWAGLLAQCAGVNASKEFDIKGMYIAKKLKDIEIMDLYKILDRGNEIGRFYVNKKRCPAVMGGLIIYKEHRNRGFFKKTINEIINLYGYLDIYVREDFMINHLRKDDRFKEIDESIKNDKQPDTAVLFSGISDILSKNDSQIKEYFAGNDYEYIGDKYPGFIGRYIGIERDRDTSITLLLRDSDGCIIRVPYRNHRLELRQKN